VAHPEDLSAETIRSFEVVVWAKPWSGLSARVSGFYWDARDIIESQPAPEDPTGDLLQFQNVSRYVSRGIEVEASYRNSAGWFGFAGAAVAQVGTEDVTGALVFGGVTNAPPITVGAGLSTPKLAGLAHLSAEAIVLGERPTRPDENDRPSAPSPPWAGINLTIYAPDIIFKRLDLTAGVRNLIGTRDMMPAPGDYDRSIPDALVIARVPGEGRELHVKLGYSY
jgi:outer membrane receptor protein involved in Fe transport